MSSPHPTDLIDDPRRPGLGWLRRGCVLPALIVVAVLAGAWLLLGQQGPRPAPRDVQGRPVLRVLFIGNSLTRSNDLPRMVWEMCRQAGEGPVIEFETLMAGGTDLGDHWGRGAPERIAEGWDFVVLQQGPSSLPESRQILLGYARTYGPAIREAGARPAFYMVWPEERHSHTFERACESYRLAAREIDAVLLPAGEAWRDAWRRDPDMPLYGPDRFHPSAAGTYLAALVITARLTGRSPLDLPDPSRLDLPALQRQAITAEQVRVLKEAAIEALERERPAGPASGPATRSAGGR